MPSRIIRPNGDSKADWTENPVGTSFSVLDDVVTQPTAPSTAGDLITSATDNQFNTNDYATFTIPAAETVVTATLWVYLTTPAGRACQLSIVASGAETPSTTIAAGTAASWRSVTYTGTLSQAQVDGIQTSLIAQVGTGTVTAYAAYLEVITSFRTLGSTGVGR